MGRKDKLLQMLKARTKHDGSPKPGYAENVASIRAELEQLADQAEEQSHARQMTQGDIQ